MHHIELSVSKGCESFGDPRVDSIEIDFEGLNGRINVRQAQVRFQPRVGRRYELAVSLEDPAPQVTGGEGVSRLPDIVASGQLTWANVGPLSVGQSVTVTVQFTATAAVANTINLAEASAIDANAVSLPSQVDSDTVTIVQPAFAITKTRVTSSPVSVGQLVSFEIVVANTGGITLNTVPLTDTFDNTYLSFSSASSSPMPTSRPIST